MKSLKTVLSGLLMIVGLTVANAAMAQGWCWDWTQGCMPAVQQSQQPPMNSGGGSNNNIDPNTGSAIGSSAPRVILPDSWGAVAWNFKTGGFDSSFGMASSSTAKSLAMQKCGKGCKITTTYKNQCLAYAFGSQPKAAGYFSNVSDRNQARAEQLALNNCSEKAQNCQIVISECSMP